MKTENSSRTIRIIPAAPKVEFEAGVLKKETHAALGRVSTKKEQQESSYEAQEKYWDEKLGGDESINYLGFFGDKKSGKSMASRPEFMKLINIALAGGCQRIHTKSVSRFSRNLRETIEMVEKLREKECYITFENFNIDTKDDSKMLILKIAAMIAEEELRNLQANIKWRVEQKRAKGMVWVGGKVYGYLINNNDEKEATEFEIVPWEATIVQQIYKTFLAGKTINDIANDLTEREIPTPRGKAKWQPTTIHTILTNEKYVGDLYHGKTYKATLTSKRVKNENNRDMTIVENNHLPIIERELWNQVQAEMKHREHTNKIGESGGKYSSRYPFSSRSECICGSKLRRHSQWSNGNKTPIWVCIRHQGDRDACAQKPIKEAALEDAFVGAMAQAEKNKEDMISKVKGELEAAIAGTAHLNLDEMQVQLESKQQELLDLNKVARGKVSTDQMERALVLMDEVTSLRENISIAEKAAEAACLLEYRLKMIDTALVMSFAKFNEDLFKMLIERVIQIDKTTLRFIFKGGFEIEQKTDKQAA